jgi:hypothetical protein
MEGDEQTDFWANAYLFPSFQTVHFITIIHVFQVFTDISQFFLAYMYVFKGLAIYVLFLEDVYIQNI